MTRRRSKLKYTCGQHSEVQRAYYNKIGREEQCQRDETKRNEAKRYVKSRNDKPSTRKVVRDQREKKENDDTARG